MAQFHVFIHLWVYLEVFLDRAVSVPSFKLCLKRMFTFVVTFHFVRFRVIVYFWSFHWYCVPEIQITLARMDFVGINTFIISSNCWNSLISLCLPTITFVLRDSFRLAEIRVFSQICWLLLPLNGPWFNILLEFCLFYIPSLLTTLIQLVSLKKIVRISWLLSLRVPLMHSKR